MIKSREVTYPASCLNRARAEEPLFVLRANDELAPDIVRMWAYDYLDQKKKLGLTPAQHKKYLDALDLATDMETWKKANPDG